MVTGAFSSAGASLVKPRALFTASTTALLVTVAPLSASMFSPMAKGPLWPMNCSANSGSSITRVPMYSVWVEASMYSLLTLPSSPTVTFTMTTASPKPLAVVRREPSSSVVTGAFSSAGASLVKPRALFTASTTALLVMVAPLSASMFSPMAKGPAWPMNCSAKAASSATRVP